MRDEVGVFRAADGVELRYTRRGRGERRVILVVPGILMHRNGCEHRLLAERLASVGDVVSLDVRGHGDSGGRFTWGLQEPEDVAALATSLRRDYDRVGALGFSFGGFHAMVAAALHRPFDAVASVGAPHRLFILDHNFLSRGLARTIPLALRRLRRRPRLALGPFARRPVPSRLVARIAPTPLLIAHGTDDWLISPRHARVLHARAGEPRHLLMVERGLHAEYMLADDPEPLLEGLSSFFEARL